MSDAVIRLTGRPKIDRDTSGLRRITRTYIVQGSAVTEGNVEDQVFLPYGTPDVEYDNTITQDLTNGGLTNSEVTGAYLVEQSIAPGQSMNEAVLTRIYQELDASNEPVQLGKDEIVRGAQDRLTVTRKFLVKNPYTDHYQGNRIGVSSITVAGSVCYLGTVQSSETEVYTTFTEVYFQDGILSESVQYKFGQYPNHKLEVRTHRSVVDITNPPSSEGPGDGPWFRIDEKEGPGNQDYGQLGRTIQTVSFVKGEGLISEDSQVKGKPPNTVVVTTIKYLTGEDGNIPAENIPDFTRQTFQGSEEKDGYELHTIRGIVLSTDNGVVDVTVDYKHGEKPAHKLEVAKAISYGVPATSQNVLDFVYPGGDTTSLGGYVVVSEKENTTGEFDVFTTTFARGLGTISESSKKVGMTTVTEQVSLHPSAPVLNPAIQAGELSRRVEQLDGYQKLTVSITTEDSGIVDSRYEEKNNGALKIQTIMQLGETWNSGSTPSGYVEVSVRNHRYDIYPAITKVYAQGVGVISTSTRKVGMTEVTETVSLHPNTPTLGSAIQTGELLRKVDQLDGYQKLTVSTTTDDSGIVDSKYEKRNNGALEMQTILQIGSTWDTNNTPAGYVEISNRVHRFDIYPAITKVFAKGSGVVSTSNQKEGATTITTVVELFPSSTAVPTDVQEGELNRKVDESNGYKTLTVSKVTQGSKLVDWSTEERHNGALEVQSKTLLGDVWDAGFTPVGYVEVSHRIHTYKAYPAVTKSWAKGTGTIQTGTREEGFFNIESFILLGDASNIPAEAVNVVSVEERGYKKHSYEIKTPIEGREEINVSYSTGLKTSEKSRLNEAYTGDDANAGHSNKFIDSKNFIARGLRSITTLFKRVTENYSSGVFTKTVTDISDEANTDFSNGGTVEQIASNLFRNTVVDVSMSEYESTDFSFSTGLKRTSTDEIANAKGTLGNLGGRIEQIGESIFRNRKVEVEPAVYTDISSSYSEGYVKTTKTTIDTSAKAPGNSGGLTEQLADQIFRNRVITVKPAALEESTKSYGGGLLRETDVTVGGTIKIDGNLGGKGVQIADGLFKNTNFNASAAGYLNERTSFSGGVKTETISTIGAKGNKGNAGGGYEQLADDVFRNTKIEQSAAHFLSTDHNYSKWWKTTTTRTIGSSAQAPGNAGGSSSQIGVNLFSNSVSNTTANNGSGTRTTFSNGGAVKVETTEGPGVSGGLEFSSTPTGNPVVPTIGTSTNFSAGPYSGETKSMSGYLQTETTVTAGSSSTLGQSMGSVTQVAPSVFIKKVDAVSLPETEVGKSVSLVNSYVKKSSVTRIETSTIDSDEYGNSKFITHNNNNSYYANTRDVYEVDDSVSGKTISKKTHYREGVKFETEEALEQPPTPAGEEVEREETSLFVPSGSGGVQILKKYKVTGATLLTSTWTSYDTRTFEKPGLIVIGRHGLTVVPPSTMGIGVRIETEISDSPVSNIGNTYNPPSASVSWHVGFQSRDDAYNREVGGSNFVYHRATTTDLNNIDDFQGYEVFTSTQSNSGDQAASWNPKDYSMGATSTLIYSANDFKVYRNEEIFINERPALS